LALLRSLASSPAAAAATLRTRSGTVETESAEDADLLGERSVLDLDDTDTAEFFDAAPGGQEGDDQPGSERERLLRLARQADKVRGPKLDAKLARAIQLVKTLLQDGYQPILFCRFIPTAEYVAEELRKALPKNVAVMAVTGILPPEERELRVAQLGQHEKRVLVATDCLSEGINLQAHFNAVMHYDLSWNPTRHEQREGRVDRYGQATPTVRTLTFYGVDNQIDGVVLNVLLRKHKSIRTSLGISVPVPGNTGELVQALMQGLLLRGVSAEGSQLSLFDASDDFGREIYASLHTEWDNVTEREKQSRTVFAQRTLDVSEVAQEWQAMRAAIGTGVDVERFVTEAVKIHGGFVSRKQAITEIHLPNEAAIREAVGGRDALRARFELPVAGDLLYLGRTHPVVEGLASYVMDTALDPLLKGEARRCGAIRTRSVSTRTTLLLVRFRYHIVARGNAGDDTPLLAEECSVFGFTGAPSAAEWLTPEQAGPLLQAEPDANIAPQQATTFVRRVVEEYAHLQEPLNRLAEQRAALLLEAHQRVRTANRQRGVRYEVRPQLPPDLLGIYVLLPVIG
jgi:hypothetical protein